MVHKPQRIVRNNPFPRVSVQGKGCMVILGILAAVLLLWALLLPGLWPMSWFLFSIYSNPIGWLLLFVMLGVTVALATRLKLRVKAVGALVGAALMPLWVLWWIISGSVMLHGLYERTAYEPVATLVPLMETRAVSYAEAQENFKNQNPDTRFAPGDLDYVNGHWVAEFGPNGGFDLLNKLIYPSQGFFLYDPAGVDKVQIVRQKMPFAENGLLWNSAEFFVRQHDPFVEFHEVLYVPDGNSDYMAMISLIKRAGWARVPYVAEIGLIHSDGSAEWLAPEEAEADPRLEGIQIEPEWLAAKKTEAYGWRNGIWAGLITRQGRVSVQRSAINEENSAPYHLVSADGMMWYTPFGPLNKDSLKGIMMEPSNVIDGPVYVWELPGDQAYQGVDALATEIKAAPNHPADVNWLRVSQGEESEVRSGDTDVIELLPAPRLENDRVVLYFSGYVAIDPPTRTRFYVIINAETREVLQDVYSVAEVNAWLRGELTLGVQHGGQQGAAAGSGVNLAELSEQELLDLLQAVVEELRRR
ncbi:MAG: hypothetical protein JW726_10465 [Anaerolineales bacterium]|nr:hypothetical protein [Anaerolineales bacterium]